MGCSQCGMCQFPLPIPPAIWGQEFLIDLLNNDLNVNNEVHTCSPEQCPDNEIVL